MGRSGLLVRVQKWNWLLMIRRSEKFLLLSLLQLRLKSKTVYKGFIIGQRKMLILLVEVIVQVSYRIACW